MGRRACATPADIRDPGQVEAAVETVCESLGGLDLLVNNAGGQFPSPAEGISPNGWRAVVETNLTGTFLVTREVARRALLPQRSGAIVNVVVDMSRGLPGAAHSGAARAGVENLTRSLAVEWGPHNIRVNAIAPGAVRTLAVAEAYPEDVVALLRRITPLGRMGEPEEVAWLVAYLASEAGAYITGATIPLDGGSRLWGTAWNLLPGREGSGGS